jgi:hypothetical protein
VIRVDCPGCRREYEFTEPLGGMTVVCNVCAYKMTVPSNPATPPAAGAAPPVPASPSPPPEPPGVAPHSTRPVPHAAVPEFGVERARALLRTGVSYPESIRRLTALGLTPEAATAAVDYAVHRSLEEQVDESTDPLERTDRHLRLHSTLSVVAAGACILFALLFLGLASALRVGIMVFGAVAIIWFPGSEDTYTSPYSNVRPSPGVLVRWCGWFLMAIVAFLLVWAAFTVDHFPSGGTIRSRWGVL